MIKYKKISHNIISLFPKLKELLENDSEILFAYCFGSYGRGNYHSLSDVDIALYLSLNVRDVFEKKLALQEVLSRALLTDEIDIVILNGASVSLAIEVLRTGKLLYCSDDNSRFDFEVEVITKYLDSYWLREISESSLIKRIKEGKYGSFAIT